MIDPENIDEYIAMDGYQALGKGADRNDPATRSSRPSWIPDCAARGGGGFPTGLKWKLRDAAPGRTRSMSVCNADEGDPGAFMDRSVLEGDPHAVLEAMAIAGYAIGADEGYIYVRAEYPIAVQASEDRH